MGIIETTSSSRYKTNIVDLPERYVHNLYRFRPVEFNYKYENEMMSKKSIGLIAEEVEEYMPEVVIRNMLDRSIIEGVDYENLVAPLIKIVQQHQQQIQELQAYINSHDLRPQPQVARGSIPPLDQD